MSTFARRKFIGRTDVGRQMQFVAITGLSIGKGDTSDANGFSTTGLNSPDRVSVANAPDDQIPVGWGYSQDTIAGQRRDQLMIFLPLRDLVPAFSRVFQAVMWLELTKGAWPGNVVNNNATVRFHGIRRPGFNFDEAKFSIFATGQLWNEYGGEVGTDLTTLEVGNLPFTQSDYDFLAADGNRRLFKSVDITTEFSYHTDRNEDFHLMGLVWTPPNKLERNYFSIDAVTTAGTPHSYIEVVYVPPIVFHAAQIATGRPIDLSVVLDVASFESKYHVFGGYIDQGETGDWVKAWLRNARIDRIARRLVIEQTRSFASDPVRNPANSSAKTLRSVDCYQLTLDVTGATTALTPRGAWQIIATDPTHYDLYLQADFLGAFVQVATGRLFSADETIVIGGDNALRIRAAKWGTGTVALNDIWTFETVSDTTSPAYPTDSKSMMKIAPPTAFAGDSVDEGKKKPLLRTSTQRLRAASYEFDDSGTDRSVLLVGDTQLQNYEVGLPVYVFDGTGFEAAVIHAVKLTADALPTGAPGGETGDALVLEGELSRTYAAGAFVTSGLYMELLEKSQDTTVNTGGAAAGQNSIPVANSVLWAPGDQFAVVSMSTGQVQTLILLTNSVSSLQATTNLNFTLAAGDLVIKSVSNNAGSFFFQGAVPEGADLGDRFAILRAYEARSSLKNII